MAKSDDLVKGYAQGLFAVLRAEGELERVEDELFRFGKVLESNHELKQALSDASIDRAQRLGLLEDLLGEKFSPHTVGLISFVVGQGRARQLPQILEELSRAAAEARDSVVAEVRSAVPLDGRQQKDLAAALEAATGKRVELKVLVDPSVLGGIVAKVGDTVIDGTIRRRLQDLREGVGSSR